MADEPCAQYIRYLMNKMLSRGTFVVKEDNLVIGESVDLIGLPNESFPRMEFLITKIKWDGYIDQRMENQSFRFQINAYIRRENDAVVEEDMFMAIRWGREIKRIVSMSHIDRIKGNPPCDGFMQMDGFPEVFPEYELITKITTVIFVGEVEICLPDTYTNN
jgi:hypothetical protein